MIRTILLILLVLVLLGSLPLYPYSSAAVTIPGGGTLLSMLLVFFLIRPSVD